MTGLILSPEINKQSECYRLPEAHRALLHSLSDSHKMNTKIESERQAFIEKFGDEFGSLL